MTKNTEKHIRERYPLEERLLFFNKFEEQHLSSLRKMKELDKLNNANKLDELRIQNELKKLQEPDKDSSSLINLIAGMVVVMFFVLIFLIPSLSISLLPMFIYVIICCIIISMSMIETVFRTTVDLTGIILRTSIEICNVIALLTIFSIMFSIIFAIILVIKFN